VRFIEETKRRPQVGVYPLVVIPTGYAKNGLGAGRYQAFFPVWLQKSWGDEGREWTTYGGGGDLINPGHGKRNWGYVGALLQKRVADSLILGVEVFHQTQQEDERSDSTWLNGGGIYDLSDTYHLLLSAGHSVDGESGFRGFLGLRFNFEAP